MIESETENSVRGRRLQLLGTISFLSFLQRSYIAQSSRIHYMNAQLDPSLASVVVAVRRGFYQFFEMPGSSYLGTRPTLSSMNEASFSPCGSCALPEQATAVSFGEIYFGRDNIDEIRANGETNAPLSCRVGGASLRGAAPDEDPVRGGQYEDHGFRFSCKPRGMLRETGDALRRKHC